MTDTVSLVFREPSGCRMATSASTTPASTRLPFRSDAFHYVSNQFSYPHMQHKERLVSDVLRVLRPGGRFVVTNIDPWAMDGWVLYRFFPAARVLDHRDFMTADKFTGVMHGAGFVNIELDREHRRTRESLGEYLAFASERHRTSHFVAMSDEDYRAGVRTVIDTKLST